ncbi:hypothetical protein VTN77DRAFT_1131 [Rasamsonia byssochlamydoides]|uniref:uncharacterized protein n=1 Tax=Rasamsonia byssochlamydoides TaxID=89139 RepID=UPI003742F398
MVLGVRAILQQIPRDVLTFNCGKELDAFVQWGRLGKWSLTYETPGEIHGWSVNGVVLGLAGDIVVANLLQIDLTSDGQTTHGTWKR